MNRVPKPEFLEQTTALFSMAVKALVDHPENVVVTHIEGEQTVVFEVAVNKEDLGKVIGKMGKNAAALRTILFAVSSKCGYRSILEIKE